MLLHDQCMGHKGACTDVLLEGAASARKAQADPTTQCKRFRDLQQFDASFTRNKRCGPLYSGKARAGAVTRKESIGR
jgi:hypothetical protein